MGDNYMLVIERLNEECERLKLPQQRLCSYMHMLQSNFSKSKTGHRRFSYPEVKGLCDSMADVFYIFTGIKAPCSHGLPELPFTHPEELLCCLNSVYLHSKAAKSMNQNSTVFGTIQKQLEYIQCTAGSIDDRNNVFYQIQHRYGYTQDSMAELLGVSTRSLQALEKGTKLPDSEMIWKMYDRFLVSPAFILNDPKGMRNELNYVLGLLEENDREIMLKILENGYRLIRPRGRKDAY